MKKSQQTHEGAQKNKRAVPNRVPFLRKQRWPFIVGLFLSSLKYVPSQRLGQVCDIGIILPLSRRQNCVTVN